jgi:hypothetical protein
VVSLPHIAWRHCPFRGRALFLCMGKMRRLIERLKVLGIRFSEYLGGGLEGEGLKQLIGFPREGLYPGPQGYSSVIEAVHPPYGGDLSYQRL